MPTPPRKPAPSLEAFADQRHQARHTDNQAIARSNRILRATLAEQEKELATLRARIAA